MQGVERRGGRVQRDPGGKRGRGRQGVVRYVAHGPGRNRDVQRGGAAAAGRAGQGGDGGLFVGCHCKQDGLRVAQRNDAGAVQADGVGRGGRRQLHGRRIRGCRVDCLVKLDKDRPRGQVDRRAGQPGRPVVLYDVRRIGRRAPEHAVVRVAHGRRRDVDRGVARVAGALVRPRDRCLLCRGEVDGDCGGRPGSRQRSARERRRAAGAVAAHYRNAREVDGPGGHGGVKGERYGPGGKVHGGIHNARSPAAGRRRGHRQARGRQQAAARRVARKVRKRAGGRLVDAHGAARVVVQRARRGGLGRRKPNFQHRGRLDRRERRACEGDGGAALARERQEPGARALRPHALVELERYRAAVKVQRGLRRGGRQGRKTRPGPVGRRRNGEPAGGRHCVARQVGRGAARKVHRDRRVGQPAVRIEGGLDGGLLGPRQHYVRGRARQGRRRAGGARQAHADGRRGRRLGRRRVRRDDDRNPGRIDRCRIDVLVKRYRQHAGPHVEGRPRGRPGRVRVGPRLVGHHRGEAARNPAVRVARQVRQPGDPPVDVDLRGRRQDGLCLLRRRHCDQHGLRRRAAAGDRYRRAVRRDVRAGQARSGLPAGRGAAAVPAAEADQEDGRCVQRACRNVLVERDYDDAVVQVDYRRGRQGWRRLVDERLDQAGVQPGERVAGHVAHCAGGHRQVHRGGHPRQGAAEQGGQLPGADPHAQVGGVARGHDLCARKGDDDRNRRGVAFQPLRRAGQRESGRVGAGRIDVLVERHSQQAVTDVERRERSVPDRRRRPVGGDRKRRVRQAGEPQARGVRDRPVREVKADGPRLHMRTGHGPLLLGRQEYAQRVVVDRAEHHVGAGRRGDAGAGQRHPIRAVGVLDRRAGQVDPAGRHVLGEHHRDNAAANVEGRRARAWHERRRHRVVDDRQVASGRQASERVARHVRNAAVGAGGDGYAQRPGRRVCRPQRVRLPRRKREHQARPVVAVVGVGAAPDGK